MGRRVLKVSCQFSSPTSSSIHELVEDTGDMLIMTWAYTNYTGVGDLATIYVGFILFVLCSSLTDGITVRPLQRMGRLPNIKIAEPN